MKTRVFVAGPYTVPDPELNTLRAILAGHTLMDAGYAPYVPHLCHFMEKMRPRPYGDWTALDNEYLPLCHALLRLPGESKGADAEEALARSLGIPVFHDLLDLLASVSPLT